MGDDKGRLIAFEKGVHAPFEVRRAFYIFDSKSDAVRGCHANRKSQFLMMVLSGSCRVRVETDKESVDFLLNTPRQALYLDAMVWKEMYEFSYNATLLVLSSEPYNEDEYVRDYDEWKREVQAL